MLRALGIRDFVIVDRLDLDFQPGFTALTGETGAGKSILIDALALVLGARGDANLVREGCSRAEISAEFSIDVLPALTAWLEANDLADDPGVCLVRRVLESNGRSRAYVNGRASTLQQLKELSEQLVDIHGQHEHQSLLRSASQRGLLDAFAGNDALLREVETDWRNWQVLKRQREAWEKNAEALAAERETLGYQVEELKRLNFTQAQWDELQGDHSRLAHAASLTEAVEHALEVLSEGENAALATVNGVIARLSAAQAFDPALKESLEMLEPAQIQIQETVYHLRHYRQRLELDPQRLREVEQRLEAIHSAARKYRVRPEQLPESLTEASAKLDLLGGDQGLENLEKRETDARRSYLAVAGKLSAARKHAAKTLSQSVSTAMQTLAMAGGKFEVALDAVPDGAVHGLENIEFQVAAHPGASLRPLAKVASGGELSRLSLAIQTAASSAADVPVLIFDEVDAGIGGRVADIVGRLLRELGTRHQVMCITHLPQVAAAADQQWQVSKREANGSVVSTVSVLDRKQRVDEIARMLGGMKITDTTRKHAAEMLGVKA